MKTLLAIIKGLRLIFGKAPAEWSHAALFQGLLLRYGLTLANEFLWLGGPVGWLLGLLGLPLVFASEYFGDRVLARPELKATLLSAKSPWRRVLHIQQLWESIWVKQSSFPSPYQLSSHILREYNRLLKELLPDEVTVYDVGNNTPYFSALRQIRWFLSCHPKRGLGRWIRMLLELTVRYRSGRLGRLISWLFSFRRVPVLRWTVWGVLLISHGLFFWTQLRRIKKQRHARHNWYERWLGV